MEEAETAFEALCFKVPTSWQGSATAPEVEGRVSTMTWGMLVTLKPEGKEGKLLMEKEEGKLETETPPLPKSTLNTPLLSTLNAFNKPDGSYPPIWVVRNGVENPL